jgi:DNA-binding transcriptional LysR family regulator
MLAAEMRRRGLRHHVVVELDSMDMIKRYVALGMGVSVGPRLAIEPEDEERLGVVSLATLLPVEQAGIVTQPGKVLSNPAQDFIDQVLRVTGAPRFVP